MQLERCEFEDASASLEGEHSAAVEVIFPGFSEFFSWLRRCFFLDFFLNGRSTMIGEPIGNRC